MSIAKVFDLKQIHGFGIQRLLHQRTGKGNDIWERPARRSALFCKTNPGGRSFDSEEEPSSTGWKSARNGLIKSAEHEHLLFTAFLTSPFSQARGSIGKALL
jgi:hypothetical protein